MTGVRHAGVRVGSDRLRCERSRADVDAVGVAQRLGGGGDLGVDLFGIPSEGGGRSRRDLDERIAGHPADEGDRGAAQQQVDERDDLFTLGEQRDLLLRVAGGCLLYTSPSPRDLSTSRMPSSA